MGASIASMGAGIASMGAGIASIVEIKNFLVKILLSILENLF
jgi:hypothetical protein